MSADPTMLAAAWKKLQSDLEWRGPGGKAMNFVCLTREMAEALLASNKATNSYLMAQAANLFPKSGI